TTQERGYLAGFVHGLYQAGAESPGAVPVLPAQAPLTPVARHWVDGLLAGLFSRAPEAAAVPDAAPTMPEEGPGLTLLWASQTGNAEALAGRFAMQLAAAGYQVSTACMDEFQCEQLASVPTLVLISSTFGDGDPPDNGQAFWRFLNSAEAPALTTLRY